jgi:putative pyruvate formate lyase activating enzyme
MEPGRRRFLKSSFFAACGAMPFVSPSASITTALPRSRLEIGVDFVPAYKNPARKRSLAHQHRELRNRYKNCDLCPRVSEINRLRGETDVCKAPPQVKVASAYPHFGEEKPLVGRHGSGTIFFSHCSLRCVFCINYEISWEGEGRLIDDDHLAYLMLNLQRSGCKNINLVTPTHYIPNIVNAVRLASPRGLHLPLVYNTSAYDRVETLRMLEGVVDIFMPDLKFLNPDTTHRLCSEAKNYPESATAAILEMHRQVGDLVLDARGNAMRGLLIRHLVMPHNVSDSDRVVRWIADNLPKSTYVNIMGQYRPEYRAREFPEIARPVSREEFAQAVVWARDAGLTNLDPSSLGLLRYLK